MHYFLIFVVDFVNTATTAIIYSIVVTHMSITFQLNYALIRVLLLRSRRGKSQVEDELPP